MFLDLGTSSFVLIVVGNSFVIIVGHSMRTHGWWPINGSILQPPICVF